MTSNQLTGSSMLLEEMPARWQRSLPPAQEGFETPADPSRPPRAPRLGAADRDPACQHPAVGTGVHHPRVGAVRH